MLSNAIKIHRCAFPFSASVSGHTRPCMRLICHAATKPKSTYVCPNCMKQHSRWGLKCEECGQGNLVEERKQEETASSAKSPSIKLLQSNRVKMSDAWLPSSSLSTEEEEEEDGGRSDEGETLSEMTNTSSSRKAGGKAATHSTRRSSWIDPLPSGSSSPSGSLPPSLFSQVRSLSDLNSDALSSSSSNGGRRKRPERIVLSGRTGTELGRCLSGPESPGIVPGSFVLIGGDPGIGKSTLMLQLAAMVSNSNLNYDNQADEIMMMEEDMEDKPLIPSTSAPSRSKSTLRSVLYISGEEKQEALTERALRMGLGSCDSLYVASISCLDEIYDLVDQMRPTALVVDSIQTVYLEGVGGSHGSVSQIKESGQVLRQVANRMGVAVFLIGHVTKSGEVAGPKLLEHIVDTVLFLEGESGEERRLLRVVKNRHGPTDEVGVFTMSRGGMRAVENASSLFVDLEGMHGEGEGGKGASPNPGSSAILGVSLMGNRAVMLEVQALCTKAYSQQAPIVRQATGVSRERFNQLVHVMSKVCPSLRGLTGHHVYASVIKGASFKEPAGDLPMALSIASSFFERPLPARMAAFGEIDLAGKIRQVNMVDKRIGEVMQTGYCDVVLVPRRGSGGLGGGARLEVAGGCRVVEVGTLMDALREAIGDVVDKVPVKKRGAQVEEEGSVNEGWEDEDSPLLER